MLLDQLRVLILIKICADQCYPSMPIVTDSLVDNRKLGQLSVSSPKAGGHSVSGDSY